MKNAKDRKNIEKSGKKSRFELFYPGNLQKEIDSYGYSFSMGKYSLFSPRFRISAQNGQQAAFCEPATSR